MESDHQLKPQKRRSSEKNTYTTTVTTNGSLKARNASRAVGHFKINYDGQLKTL